MLPYFEITHFYIGPIKIYTWGLFIGLAFSVGYFWVLWQGRKKGLADGKIIGLVLFIFFGAAMGSRVLFLLQEPSRWLADVSLLWRIDAGGLMLWGGILGGILAGRWYIKKIGWSWRAIADLATPALALGIGIGYLGCFLINDHIGTPTSLGWGILWPDGITRHPVAAYLSLAGFSLFGIFWFLARKIKQPGQLFLLFTASFSAWRFLLDFARQAEGPLADPHWLGLTSSQWVGMGMLVFSVWLFGRRAKSSPESIRDDS